MGLVTGVTLPNDGDRVQAADYNDPINKILDEVNGNLDSNNIASLSGAKITAGTVPVTALDSTVSTGWTPLSATFSVASGYNQGNKSFVLNSNTDLTSVLSAGQRFKVNRSTTPPTQAVDLELTSSQYAISSTGTGISFTDTFTIEAWVKVESLGGTMNVICRRNGNSYFLLRVQADGTVVMYGGNTGGTTRNIASTVAVTPGQWCHIAAALSMSSGTGAIYINGISVGTTVSGTATSLTQSGSIAIGARPDTPSEFFDGVIADVRVWSTVRTATQINDNMCQQLTGSETGLVGYWKLNGNYNDSTANANNMTATNSPVFVTDNPMKSTEYAIITNVTSSQITVYTGTDYSIPNMTLSSPYFSTQKAPQGFPTDPNKWTITTLSSSTASGITPGSAVTVLNTTVPVGSWRIQANIYSQVVRSSATAMAIWVGLSTSSLVITHTESASYNYDAAASATTTGTATAPTLPINVTLTTATPYYVVVDGVWTTLTLTTVTQLNATTMYHSFKAVCAFL